MGGATSALIACPSELIKCILQAQAIKLTGCLQSMNQEERIAECTCLLKNHHTIESPKQAVGYILQDRGLTGFYKGTGIHPPWSATWHVCHSSSPRWSIDGQIFDRDGIYFSARYSCLCCFFWILFCDKGKCPWKFPQIFLKMKKGDIFATSLKNELKNLNFNDWNSSLIAGQDANWKTRLQKRFQPFYDF